MLVSITCARFDTHFIVSMPHKHWGMSPISDIIEHIDFINLGGQIADFRRPPLGWRNQGAGAWATPPPPPVPPEI